MAFVAPVKLADLSPLDERELLPPLILLCSRRPRRARELALPAVTLAIVLLAGCGGGEERARPAWKVDPSETQPRKGPGGPADRQGSVASERDLGEGIGVAQNTAGEARASSSGSAGSTDETRTVSSTGTATLFFNVDRPSSFVWRNTKGDLFSAQGRGVAIASRRGRGEVELRPGRYSVLVSGGAWSVAVRPE